MAPELGFEYLFPRQVPTLRQDGVGITINAQSPQIQAKLMAQTAHNKQNAVTTIPQRLKTRKM